MLDFEYIIRISIAKFTCIAVQEGYLPYKQNHYKFSFKKEFTCIENFMLVEINIFMNFFFFIKKYIRFT